MSYPRDTFVPIEKEQEIKCNISECAGGTGLAGNGHCFLAGNPYITNCPEFISDDDFEERQLQNIHEPVE